MKHPTEDFENFCRRNGHGLKLNSNGGYLTAQTKAMYRAWLTAYALYAPKPAKVKKLGQLKVEIL